MNTTSYISVIQYIIQIKQKLMHHYYNRNLKLQPDETYTSSIGGSIAPCCRVCRGKRLPWELYNIAVDRSEMNNLAEKMPEKVAELSKLWNDWATRCHVSKRVIKGDKNKK